jgi:SNF2 family DNA or RNA helicase
MNDLEILEEPEETPESRLEKAQRVYEDVIEADKEMQASLTPLIEEERQLMAALAECKRKQREIEAERYKMRADIRKAEREKDEAEFKMEETLRLRRLEQQKADAFNQMVADAREAKYAWVDIAMDHQWEGAMSIAHYGSAVLGDEMGTGKTLTSIMSWDLKKSKKVLVVVPGDVVSDFATSIQVYAPHRNVIPMDGPTPAMRKMIKQIVETSSEVTVVTNYQSLWRDFKWVQGVHWDEITIDEAHNMKNEKGLTFNALDQMNYKNALCVTGTSILNEPGDLYTSLHMIAPQIFWDKWQFLNNYCMQNADGKWIFRPGGEKALVKTMKGRFIKRTMQECGIELPEQKIEEILIPRSAVTEEQRMIMKQIADYNEILLENGEGMEINARIAVITRERQAACFPAGIELKVTKKMYDLDPRYPVGHVLFKVPDNIPSIKLDIAEERIHNQIKAGNRGVVFSQFKTALVDLERRLTARGLRVARYDGDTKDFQRVNIKRDFLRPRSGERKADYQYDVVLANYKTGGVGLNFTDAVYTLVLDEEWNPGKNDQAYARTNRIGQTEETLVEVLRIEKAICMWMKTINEVKQAIINGFEQEIDVTASLKEYFASQKDEAIEAPEQKAIEAFDPDDEFLDFLNSIDLD